MLLDDLMPDFDATRIEHRVISAPRERVYSAAVEADFLDAVRSSRVVRGLFAARAGAERLAQAARRSPAPAPPEPESLRLSDLPERGDWVRLGEDPPREFAFGVVGRFWGGETSWEQIDSTRFTTFDRPGYARIACNLSLRDYGDTRTLLSYEARTRATDETARRAFLRYWGLVSPGVGIVMRSTLAVIDRAVARAPGAVVHPEPRTAVGADVAPPRAT
jgi:hypothetical protein